MQKSTTTPYSTSPVNLFIGLPPSAKIMALFLSTRITYRSAISLQCMPLRTFLLWTSLWKAICMYLYGPPPFMKSVCQASHIIGFAEDAIHYEVSGPNASLQALVAVR